MAAPRRQSRLGARLGAPLLVAMLLLAALCSPTASQASPAATSRAPSSGVNGAPSGTASTGAATLSGVVVDSFGNPLSGVMVRLWPTGHTCYGTPVAVVHTDTDGTFSVSASPASYDIEVFGGGTAPDPSFVLCTPNVDLTSSHDDTLTVPVTTLTVTATDPDGNPVPGATIDASGHPLSPLTSFNLFPDTPTGGNSFIETTSATTDADGHATVGFLALPGGTTLTVEPPAGSNLAATTITTGPMTTDTSVTAVLYSLSGTVSVGGTGAPGQGVTLTSTSSSPSSRAADAGAGTTASAVKPTTYRTSTRPNGFYGVAVPRGYYAVGVKGNDSKSSALPHAYSVSIARLDLRHGTKLDLALPVVSLTVYVTTKSGAPLSGVKVAVPCTKTTFTARPGVVATAQSCGLATTNARGKATVRLLATSTVTVVATPRSPYTRVTLSEVAANAPQTVTIVCSK